MAIIPMTPEQLEVLRHSLEKENASKKAEQKKPEPAPASVHEKIQEFDPAVVDSIQQEEATVEPTTSESTSFKSYKKRK